MVVSGNLSCRRIPVAGGMRRFAQGCAEQAGLPSVTCAGTRTSMCALPIGAPSQRPCVAVWGPKFGAFACRQACCHSLQQSGSCAARQAQQSPSQGAGVNRPVASLLPAAWGRVVAATTTGWCARFAGPVGIGSLSTHRQALHASGSAHGLPARGARQWPALLAKG